MKVLYIAFGLTCGVVWGQAPVERQIPLPTLKAESRLVNVAVNAVDANGAPIGGLSRSDFEIAEDGAAQKVAFFEKESATPLSIVMAIDGSESVVTNDRLEKEAGKKFVRALLRERDELDVMDFSDTVREIVAFTSDKRKIEAGLNDLTKGDATAVYDAVYLASQRLGETDAGGGRRRVLVLITDGANTVKGVSYDQAVEQAQRSGVMVYALIVVPIEADAGRNTGGEHALIQMADDTGGKYYYVNDPHDLSAIYAKVSEDLRTQYILGYYAPTKTVRSRPDGFRHIRISLTDAGLAAKASLRYRTGYYSLKQ